MKINKKYIAFCLLTIILSIGIDRTIPHSHIEIGRKVISKFSTKDMGSNKQDKHQCDGEELHSLFYELANFEYSFRLFCLFIINYQLNISDCLPNNPSIKEYNVIPKILNSILFIIHIYNSKIPPDCS